MYLRYIFCIVFLHSFFSFGQNIDFPNDFNYHIDLSERYYKSNLYVESIEEVNIAIEIANRLDRQEDKIRASINLAELMRKTQNYNYGIEILYNLGNLEKYPKQHVRKLGRLTALYLEGDFFEETFSDDVNVIDSARLFLDAALSLAITNNFKLEEASLQNEMGLFKMRNFSREESIPHLDRSAELYLGLRDSLNYIRPMIHTLENCIMSNDPRNFDSISQILLKLTNGKDWYTVEAELFKMIGKKSAMIGDSLTFYKMNAKAEKNYVQFLKVIDSKQMLSFKALYETEKMEKNASRSSLNTILKTKELDEEKSTTRKLLTLISILFCVIVIGGIIVFRERKLKLKLKSINSELIESNQKYQLLRVESNHRIKNNLQMIISMIDHASDDVSDNVSKELKRISGKIHTVSSLHRHLYMENHQEKVGIDIFFDEILKLYEELTSLEVEVEKSVDSIEIQSERIIYFGLILNELLSNSIEHNTTNLKKVSIKVWSDDDHCYFQYFDNSNLEDYEKTGMGSALIEQLIGRINGVGFTIDKKIGLYKFMFDAED